MYKLDGGLGFKDMNMFNFPLLVKQWWHVSNENDLLSSKILSAKYCSGGSLHSASKGGRDSFIWSNLLFRKIIIEEGSIWRVGVKCQISRVLENQFLQFFLLPFNRQVTAALIQGKRT